MPGNTPVILAESGDCGTTHVRFLCSEADLPHESRQISNFCPHWILNIIDHVRFTVCVVHIHIQCV